MTFKYLAAAAAAIALSVNAAVAETRNTSFGNGDDVVLRRGIANPTDNGALLIVKNQSGDAENVNNDRVALIKLDLSGLAPIGESVLRFQTVRATPATNTFAAGETLMLYGIKENAAFENFDPATVTWAGIPYMTGTDSAALRQPADTSSNNVNDTLADISLLSSFTFSTASTAGTIVDFSSLALTSFLQTDVNDVATFIVTALQTNAGNTSVLSNSDTGTEGGFPPPTLRTNTDVVNTDFVAPAGTGIEDFQIIRNNYLTGTTFAQGDANFDGVVNHVDFFKWRTAFVAVGGNVEGLSLPIPEPSSALGAIVLGLLAHASGLARRRRS
jgi:hypothetical protein